MSDISKAELRDEIAELCESQDKPLPDNFERLNLVSLFNAFEDLAGSPHPKRPVPGVGAVRASSAPPAPPAEAPAAVEAPAPVEEPSAPVEEPSAPVEEPSAPPADETPAPPPAFAFDDPPAAPAPKGARVSASGRYIVAEGHMVVCKKGKIGAFQEIRALDLADGEEGLDALFADGSVVAAKR